MLYIYVGDNVVEHIFHRILNDSILYDTYHKVVCFTNIFKLNHLAATIQPGMSYPNQYARVFRTTVSTLIVQQK